MRGRKKKDILEIASFSPIDFIECNQNLNMACKASLKRYLDPIAKESMDLDEVHIDGFDIDQIFYQVKIISEKVIDLANDDEFLDSYKIISIP